MNKVATREAYGQALESLGGVNPSVVVLDADLSKSTKTSLFAKKFPERFFNAGVAEQNLIGMAAGLAKAGKVVFASSFAVFATGRTYDQIRNSVAYSQANVKIAATHAGLSVGEDGASHQALEDLALMRVLPNMTVVVPADAVQTRQVVFALAALDGPAYLRLGRVAVPRVYPDDYSFQLGCADVLRDGNQASIVACGIMVAPALEAARELAQEGIQARVLNMATIKPLDREGLVRAARETGAVVTAEEHSVLGGLGGAVAEVLGDEAPVPLERVGVGDTFGESGPPGELLAKYGLDQKAIYQAVKRVLARK